jgi:Xaa-Pro aminopeptidase
MDFGTMAVDSEQRVDYDRLRRDRVDKAERAMADAGVDALMVFDPNNVRYLTSTFLGEWSRDKLARYSIMPRGQEPLLFDFGSAVAAKKKSCPWIAERVYPTSSWMRGSVPREAGFQEEFMDFLLDTLREQGLTGAKIGIDLIDITLLELLQKEDITLVDGQDIMLEARRVKSWDEIQLLDGAASMVDAAYGHVVANLRAGIRENELVALINDVLYRLGSDQVEAVNVVSGPRCSPHPHYFTDRIIRPDETVFLDIMHSYNGYRTCYYRTFQVGRATQPLRDAYKQCYDWLYASIDQVKPGNTTADIAASWPDATSFGFASEAAAFGLQFGHGIGMSIWEKPVISRRFSLDNPTPLEPGMVFALETYCAATDGSGAARIEEEIVVTEDGHKILTRYPCDELICVTP